MTKNVAYFLIVASSVLLFLNIYDYFFNGDTKSFWWRIASNILLIFLGISTLLKIRKESKSNENRRI